MSERMFDAPAPAPAPPPPADTSTQTVEAGLSRSLPARDAADLRAPELYLNRELSWLEFNRRVLQEARDPRIPLLERVKFLAIFASNLDEFFQVRIAGLRQQMAARLAELTPDGMTPEEQLRASAQIVRELQRDHGVCLTREVIPALAERGIELVTSPERLSSEDAAYLDHYFTANVFPVLTPLAVDPAHPFPYISNLSLSLAVILRGDNGDERFARVKVPKILPRWVPLPGSHRYVPLELVVASNLEALFPGVEILGSYPFRITRNTDLEIDPDEADDLLALIQEEVRNRRFAEVVRLEVHPALPESLRQLLLAELNADQETEGLPLTPDDVYEVEGLLDASDLLAIAGLEISELRDPSFVPAVPSRLAGGGVGAGRNLFELIREGDIFVHHPYESFAASTERFIQTAAEDPDVLAIKMTLYRTGGDSHIARMLANAAERGKQVAVLIELQARFDEENNIRWAQRFEDIGVHVSYGVAGLKTHAKVILVVRREGDQIRRYVHIGTGNYAPRTARVYTDFGLFSADPDLGADLSDLFNVLTGFASPQGYRKLVVAPAGMRKRLIELIRREIAHAEAGRSARIFAKMNALVDPEIIALLYEASRAGVTVDLLVRGISCLRPGLPGVSENITVISVVGRFLEHSRVWDFENGGAAEVYISSADWMPRNLDRRIETAVPLESASHRETVRELLELMWRDNRQAWELGSDGRWTQRQPGEAEIATHRALIERYREAARPG